jgi:H/ACA ribonucleoprotein complex subunit 4
MKIDIDKLKSEKSVQELLEFGIINVDKPAGMTSFDVVDAIRKKFGLRKASHFGTLDPMVTGVLPIALNRACKLTGFFIGEDKEYAGEMKIHEEIELAKIEEMIKEKFTGKIMQLPPVKSRVKRQLREREVMKFDLLKKDGQDISFHTEVQGGTYIRKLVHDLGQALGINAHMTKLRRIRAGIFLEKDSVKLEDVKKENLKDIIMPAEIISEVYPTVYIKEDNLKQIFTGKPIHKNDLIKNEKFEHHGRTPGRCENLFEAPKNLGKRFLLGAKEQIICVFFKERFIGMYQVIDGKDIFAKAKFVMQPISG